MLQWLGVQRLPGNWTTEITWAQKEIKWRNPKSEILGTVFTIAVYAIWAERNERRFNAASKQPDNLVRKIVIELFVTACMFPRWGKVVSELNWFPM